MTRRHHAPAALAALAVAQIVAWGVLYYAILVAAPAIAVDTGWPEEAVFLAVTAGLLTSAVCAIPIGRWLDSRPRRVMVSGAVLGSLALLGAATAPTISVFAAAWVACGAAQSAVLYQAAFTIITHRYRDGRRGPLTVVTLAGGLASTIFAPTTAWLVHETGWRLAFLILAGVVAAVLVPTYALAVERTWSHLDGRSADTTDARQVLRTTRFWALTSALALMSFSLYAVTLSAVPAAVEKGLTLQTASWVLGLVGAGQVLGRLLYLATPRSSTPWVAPVAIGVSGAVALAGFAAADRLFWIFATAILAGGIRGALTLVQASAITERWGVRSYGRLNGTLAGPVTALTAFAPGAAALLATSLDSYVTMGLFMALACAVGGVLSVRR
jgi:MFS family permease